jgi:hypothetical protein
LVVTYPGDLKQFEMFCYCLKKNWQGLKNLIVVTQQDTERLSSVNEQPGK